MTQIAYWTNPTATLYHGDALAEERAGQMTIFE